MTPTSYDPRFVRGVEHFNQCEFFEAHEVWEKVWKDDQGPFRDFYKGLIQVAVCLHHFGNGNARGARKLYHSCRRYLHGFRSGYRGINVERLIDELDRCCAGLLASRTEVPRVQIDPDLIPKIILDPPAESAGCEGSA